MSQNLSGPRNIILFLAIAAILLIFIYQNSITFENKQETIRIGITQWPAFEYLFITKKMDFFKQAGLNVELVELSSLAEVRRAFSRGKVDGMAATLVEVLEAYKYSEKVAQPILITSYSKGSDQIIATSAIKSLKQLKGKKIGIEAGSTSSYLVSYALKMNNINQSEVMIMPMEMNKLSRALSSGRVDAITSYPPNSIAIKKQMDVNVLFDSSQMQDDFLDVIAINKKILDENPSLHYKFLNAWDLTIKYANVHPDESYVILTERIPISINEFKQAMKNIHLVSAVQQQEYFSENSMIIDYFTKIGDIVFNNSKEEVNYSKFIYESNQ